MTETVYHVYLVRTGEQGNRVRGGEREVTSPVEGYELDFYDSGVWLTREQGRNFFPYEQIRTIREHPAVSEDDEADADAESAGREVGAGSPAETGDSGGEDEGAEEDMLEE
ncbi:MULTISPECIES: hypothetical protein [Halorussus]|uniref:hypothetical protein n=1 Tax=Halorussus TaxID=1070314 RepID=UPI0020A12E27|nr:hypothetical protein [Halorussus vallis]USZ76789.1 hypothetical protein NGM07_05545 [Halorussus vallis]